MTWRRVDLHIHTPASTDYRQPGVSPLDILRQAEERGLDVIALTDHNSVRGYADMWREIEDLELLEFLKRLTDDERRRLEEYRRLLARVLLLPGFEFTATFGFHILAIFPEGTTVRMMEHMLLSLGVPERSFGSGEVGATTDVLRAYKILHDHGALVIGAHANSTHGVAMQGIAFGGQTKIAYTQDPHLHALEVTDLHVTGNRRSTARFFNGSKPEYPRRMHCIQGSDAHRVERDPEREQHLGVGDRATEMLLAETSFHAIKEVLSGQDFTRTRRYVPVVSAADALRVTREDGNTSEAAFHERHTTKRDGSTAILRDVVAMANGMGGTVYVGASPNARRQFAGVADAPAAAAHLLAAVTEHVSPQLDVDAETIDVDGRAVVALRIDAGPQRPYALAPGLIYVRDGANSRHATRDEIVRMVQASASAAPATTQPEPSPPPAKQERQRHGRRRRRSEGQVTQAAPSPNGHAEAEPSPSMPEPAADAGREEEWSEPAAADPVAPPSGVEIVSSTAPGGTVRYTLHDLRNRKVVHNVGRDTTKRIWRYAIEQFEQKPVDESRIRWKGHRGFWKTYNPRGGDRRFNLVYRDGDSLRVFYAVSADGLADDWRAVVPTTRRRATATTS